MESLPNNATIDDVTGALGRDGFAIVEGVLTTGEVADKRAGLQAVLAQTPSGRNSFEGYQTQRVYALLAKTRAFDGPATHPLVLGVLDRVLGSYQLSAPQGIQIGPGEKAQPLHRDDSVYPLGVPHPELVVNTMWPLNDFTEENGATRVIPGSHRWVERRPAEGEPTRAAVMPAGSVMFFLGSVFHGGGANTTARPRLGVIIEYAAGWLRQQENQLLAIPRETVATLPPRLQELIGYGLYPPFMGVVDGQHPQKLLQR